VSPREVSLSYDRTDNLGRALSAARNALDVKGLPLGTAPHRYCQCAIFLPIFRTLNSLCMLDLKKVAHDQVRLSQNETCAQVHDPAVGDKERPVAPPNYRRCRLADNLLRVE
jgi:hypothetical protein